MTQNESAASKPAPTYWRSIAELQGSEEFKEKHLHREFPVAASEYPEGVSRRRWMQIMGASLTMAGVAGCRYPEEVIAPFVIRPEGREPGEFYERATNFELAGSVHNLLIRCFDGRPQHVETNPLHPSSVGTNPYVQASILSLFDPDRSRGQGGQVLERVPDQRRQGTSWDVALTAGREAVQAAKEKGGKGFAVLTSSTSSPTNVRLLKRLKEVLPGATLCRYDSVGGGVMRQATKAVFGTEATQTLDLSKAEVIFSIGSDFLGNDPGSLLAAKSFAEHRDVASGSMSRLYVAEAAYTTTGTMADTRLPVRPSDMAGLLNHVATLVKELMSGKEHDHSNDPPPTPFDSESLTPADRMARFADVLAHDIVRVGDKAVIVVGEALGPEAVAAGIALNSMLGSLGTLQKFVPAVDGDLETVDLATLVEQINGGEVDSFLILGDNPAVTAPGDIDLEGAIGQVANSFYLGEYDDETALKCRWSLPQSHPLESWGDSINGEGYYGVCQPQILPLMGGRSSAEVIALLLEEDVADPLKMVRFTADQAAGTALNERLWRKLLHDGFSEDIQVSLIEASVDASKFTLDAEKPSPVKADAVDGDNYEVVFAVADGLYDGRFANNGWLQEMPQTITKQTWGNSAVMSPGTAKQLGVKHGLYVTLRRGEGKVELPVFEIPGIAPGVVVTQIGYGRTRAGKVGGYADEGIEIAGIDVSPIRTSDAMLVATEVQARPNFNEYDFATTQDHWAIDELGKQETENRSFTLVREGTVGLYDKINDFAHAEPKEVHVPTFGRDNSLQNQPIQDIRKDGERDFIPQWGMVIDLSKCTGCNACVVACQSENNVPIVGPEQVRNSREMHWLRIDRYFQGNEEDATIVHQPMACLHCETAPCEQVCPVAATVHTEEGINAMAYNRCIGTRYCANNCPVKVRRFNYFNYNEDIGVGYGVDAYPGNIESANRKLQALVLNPDVTPRGRGVMEKCTYCIQRVEKGKIEARKAGTGIVKDGDVVTACQAACSTKAIDFGNIDDQSSVVHEKRKDPRAYGILKQLNIKPRTEYLARVRNPHPSLYTTAQRHDLETMKAPHHAHGDEHHEGEQHPEGEKHSGSESETAKH